MMEILAGVCKWTLISLFLIAAIDSTRDVGRARQPKTVRDVVAGQIVAVVFIVAIYALWP